MPWYTSIPARATGIGQVLLDANAFSIRPKVIVRDLRVLIFYFLVRLGIVVYVVLHAIVLSHTYTEAEVVESHASLIVGQLSPQTLSRPPAYCNNPAYNAPPEERFSGMYFGPNITCRRFERISHVFSPSSNVATLATTLVFVFVTNLTGMPQAAFVSRFTVGSEFSPVTLLLEYQTASGYFRGTNPRTCLHGPSGDVVAEVPAGTPITQLPLSAWLAAAGVDLDGINPSSNVPHLRNTGVILRVRVEYSNLRNGEWPVLGGNEVRADITVSPVAGQPAFTDLQPVVDSELGPASLLHTGVRLEVEGVGSLRHATVMASLLAVVQVRGDSSVARACPTHARKAAAAAPAQIVVLVGVSNVATRYFASLLYCRRPAYRNATHRAFLPSSDGKPGTQAVDMRSTSASVAPEHTSEEEPEEMEEAKQDEVAAASSGELARSRPASPLARGADSTRLIIRI